MDLMGMINDTKPAKSKTIDNNPEEKSLHGEGNLKITNERAGGSMKPKDSHHSTNNGAS